jgi:hypothetical protein
MPEQLIRAASIPDSPSRRLLVLDIRWDVLKNPSRMPEPNGVDISRLFEVKDNQRAPSRQIADRFIPVESVRGTTLDDDRIG